MHYSAVKATPTIVPRPHIFSAGQSIGATGHVDPANGFRWDLQGDAGPRDGVINSPGIRGKPYASTARTASP